MKIHSSLEKTVHLNRKWLEDELRANFYKHKEYVGIKRFEREMQMKHELSVQTNHEKKHQTEPEDMYYTLSDVDIVFLAGGTCRMPFFQEFIKEISSGAKIIIDGELEIITATGAAIHALQVLSGEVEPYIKIIEDQSSRSDPNKESSNELDT